MAIIEQGIEAAKGNKVVVEQHTGFEAYDEGKLICNTRCMPTGVNLCKIIAEKPGEWFRRNLEQDKKKGISLRDIKKKDFKVRKRLESIHIANNHVIEWVDSMSRELEAYGMGGPSVGECNKKNENLMEEIYRPYILVLMETKISGIKLYSVIRRIGLIVLFKWRHGDFQVEY
ncbi:hypothetical protein Gotur_007289, partial [Gossypium turneri]